MINYKGQGYKQVPDYAITTTVGEALAKKTGWMFADADDFHSQSNKNKMSQGLPLTDEDRMPWLNAIYQHLNSLKLSSQSGIVTCSALKKQYRNILRNGATYDRPKTSAENSTSEVQNVCDHVEEGGLDLVFIHLAGEESVLRSRLEGRQGHFMPQTLLRSQLDTLEPLAEDENGIVLDIDRPCDAIVEEIVKKLDL
ncbi:probable gluconokinase [Dreissena polymorpha]|uniref:Probable gluconokinase n=1 Tax=Dreissena polymorpha TaxID=45954 RepID=A0A9D4LI19_DREPO|nr:probable gluconokinase [Dreissena polymorpha]KAH3858093.1 hypothetical protein DPMN_100712 [Dreissena polymorpha]